MLGPFIDCYIAGRTDTASTTKTNYRQTRRLLCEYFGENKSMRSITAADADRWRRWLLSRPVKCDDEGNVLKTMASASVSKHVKRTKTLFAHAVRDRLLDSSPFADQKGSSEANKERHHFINRETTEIVLEACPDEDWRMIFALSRFAGIRCPSEVTAITWADVLWDQNRLRINSTKSGLRFCPIFPELRPLLETAFDAAPNGAVYVIGRYGGNADANLSTQLKRIVTSVGCVPWPKTFINLRSTRRTELQERFPSHVVDAWLGHSTKTAETHYLQVTLDHFAAGAATTTGNAPESKKRSVGNAEEKCRAVRRAIGANLGQSLATQETKKPRQFQAFDGLGFTGVVIPSDPDGNRTRVTAVKGQCPRPLDDGAFHS